MDMRKLVGKRPLVVCGAGCLIFNKEGRVLLQRRDDDNLWGNPGGSVDLGETIYDTVIREVLEETGLEIYEGDLELFNIYSGEDQHHIYSNGDELYGVNIVFKTNKYSGHLEARDGESKELKFFDIKDIPNDIIKPFIPVVRDLQKQK